MLDLATLSCIRNSASATFYLIFYQTSGTLSDSFKGTIKVLQLVAEFDLCGFVRFLSFLRSFCLFLTFSLLPHQALSDCADSTRGVALSDCAGSTRVVALSDSVRLCQLYQTHGLKLTLAALSQQSIRLLWLWFLWLNQTLSDYWCSIRPFQFYQTLVALLDPIDSIRNLLHYKKLLSSIRPDHL